MNFNNFFLSLLWNFLTFSIISVNISISSDITLELFNINRKAVAGNKLKGTQNITMMTGDRKDLDVNGLDFPLAVASAFGASKHILKFDSVKTNFVLLNNNKEDKEEWRKEFLELIEKELFKGRSLNFQLDAPETLEN